MFTPLLALIEKQKHRTLVLWALEYVKDLLKKFEAKYPNESRPHEAVDACRMWARGEVKMPVAKKAIHAAQDIKPCFFIGTSIISGVKARCF